MIRRGYLYPIRGGKDFSVIGFQLVETDDLLHHKLPAPPTENELRTLRCLANGMEPRELVSHFGVSRTRVDQYIKGLRRKLFGAKTNAQAVAIAFTIGWLALDDVEVPYTDILY